MADIYHTYFFDWGNTLMVDFPGVSGKMCSWAYVEAVEGAEQVLKHLSKTANIYVVTGAVDSTETEIEQAFARVGLHEYITGYFCKSNLGITKGVPEFLETIVKKLDVPVSRIAMVGDSWVKDIEPAILMGIHPIWFTNEAGIVPKDSRIIRSLRELYI